VGQPRDRIEPVLGPVAVIERAPGRFSITGEIDLATAHHLDTLETVHGPLLLDLHGVTFMDSTGIRALLRLRQRCPHAHCTFQIESCSLPVERVLQIAGLYELLTDGVGEQAADGESAP
jgi:anti-sigma B factor antagonist